MTLIYLQRGAIIDWLIEQLYFVIFWQSTDKRNINIQDCFLQKEATVCLSDAIVIEDSKFKLCFLLLWKMSN